MDSTKCQYLVDKIQGNLGISVKAVRVLRNPYDNIATVFLYDTLKKGTYKIPRNSSEIANFLGNLLNILATILVLPLVQIELSQIVIYLFLTYTFLT